MPVCLTPQSGPETFYGVNQRTAPAARARLIRCTAMYVIGTAGHVDHGKSRLVLALTGMDPDRLDEEKQRGLTIDLGFAWLTLPSGREISLVDVPGHERFIKNMLAGVGGIDLALFVVAADEGIMPQTREHLAILDLLHVTEGVVALTKSDLVESDWLDLVEADVEELLAFTALAGSPIVRCSAVSGAGLDTLQATLDEALEALAPPRDIGRPRLPVDRVFTISGFGTVVTGTLIDGSLRVGDQVVLEPGSIAARVRGLQNHKRKVETAEPGTRTALNLSGVAPDQIERGMVLTIPGWLRASVAMDVRLRAVADLGRPIKHNATVTVHTGSAEVPGRVRLLEGDTLAPGNEGWAQVRLQSPVAGARGDFFVLRSSDTTVGGGRIVDTRPRRHKRNDGATLAALARLLEGSPDDALLTVLQRLEPVASGELRRRSELESSVADAVLHRQFADGAAVALDAAPLNDASVVVSAAGYAALSGRAQRLIEEFTQAHPLRPGIPREELRNQLSLPAKAYAALEGQLIAAGLLAARGTAVDLPDRAVQLTAAQQQAVETLLARLQAAGTHPEAGEQVEPELAAYLETAGRIVRLGESLYLDATVHASMVEQITAAMRQRGQITLAEVRDLLDTSRKIAQAFLEDLDQRRVTRRVGDTRVLRGPG